MRHRVMVRERSLEVEVFEESPSVWVAKGTYLNLPLVIRGKNEFSALRAWRDSAICRR